MEEFPFNFNLSYQGQDYIVKPPPSLFKLKEMASKQYDIEIEEMVYIPENENDEKMVINNEQDYADLIQYVSDHNLEEIIIYIIEKKKKKMKKRMMIIKMKRKKKRMRIERIKWEDIKEIIKSIIKE